MQWCSVQVECPISRMASESIAQIVMMWRMKENTIKSYVETWDQLGCMVYLSTCIRHDDDDDILHT